MFGYYFRLAIASFRRTPGITTLMVAAIAVGIGVCVMSLTIYHSMSGNPIWWKSDQLYAVTMDDWSPNEPADMNRPSLPPDQLSYRDAMAVWRSDIPLRKTIMHETAGIVSGQGPNGPIVPMNTVTRVTTGDFFAMFDVPFRYGRGWDSRADTAPEPVIVLSAETNNKLFGGANSVSRTLRWNDREFRIIGVLDDWQPTPRFYDLNTGDFAATEQAFIPWGWGDALELGTFGSSSCWRPESLTTFREFQSSNCVWIQAWVELPNAAARSRMQAFLDAYTDNERKAGRFQRPRNNRLTDVDQWLKDQEVIKSDNRVLVGLSFAFLTVCLINTVGLLLAKFLNGASISGVRRALGARRRDLFMQHMVEVSVIALAGATLGLGLGALGLKGFRALYSLNTVFNRGGGLQSLAHIDVASVTIAIVLAVVATFAAGIYPAWRIGRIQPAVYLKNQ
jgi:putative ABC transport system permease protein